MTLARRDRRPELMDDPHLDAAEHRRALAGLARLNAFSGAVGALWRPIRQFARDLGRPVRILDVASGSGDVPLGLWQRAAKAGVPVEIVGCDISPTAVAAATERAVGTKVEFFPHDVLKDDLAGGYDVVTCSLFLHHLDEADAVTLLQRMNRAATGLGLVSDLARSPLNYGLVWFASHALTRSKVVHYDGLVSVRAAFTPAEAKELAEEAGLKNVAVASRFPCRFLLTWRPS